MAESLPMTFESAFLKGYISKTRKYLFPVINRYPQSFIKDLSKTNVKTVGLENDNFLAVVEYSPHTLIQHKYVKNIYRSLKLKHHVVEIEILDKWKPIIPLFLEGKYSQLYFQDLADFGIYPNKYGKDGLTTGPNYIYHVLNKTPLGKQYFYEKLVQRKFIDRHITKLEEFDAPEYDFPPKDYDIKLP